jgi:hypothetical protein
MIEAEQIWVFNHASGSFPIGIFTSLDLADRWIKLHRLTGTLTLYPIDTGVYEWAIARACSVPTSRIRRHPIS